MKRVIFALVAMFSLSAGVGCHSIATTDCGCAACDSGGAIGHAPAGHGLMARLHGRGAGPGAGAEAGGAPMHTYNYPYYTLRGPRDFLMANPPNLGP